MATTVVGDIVAAVLVVGLLLYLFVALIRPERF